jgi:hypothetical protein
MFLTFFTAVRCRDISESTRNFFEKKDMDEKVKVLIQFQHEWEMNVKMLSLDYLRTNFIFDFLGSIPCLLTGEVLLELYFLKIFRINRIFRILEFVEKSAALMKEKYMKN